MNETFAILLLLAIRITTGNGELYNNTKIKVLEFTYPPGSTDMPIAHWQTQANLTKNNLPTSINMCTSVYVKSIVADWNSDIRLFTIEDPAKDYERWLNLEMKSETELTSFRLWIGPKGEQVKVACKETMPIFFPKHWTRVCMSVDLDKGTIRVAVNGKMLEDGSHPDIKALKSKKPSKFTIRLGKQDNGIHSKWTDLNMFKKPLDAKKMVAITTSGAKECGTPGDFLKWEDTDWSLTGRKNTTEWGDPTGAWKDYVLVIDSAKVTENAFEDGPCWRKSKIIVYQFGNIHDHSYCMRLCAKISGGRSPSVVTEAQWKEFMSDVEAVGPATMAHCHLWQSATEGDVNGKYMFIIKSTYFGNK